VLAFAALYVAPTPAALAQQPNAPAATPTPHVRARTVGQSTAAASPQPTSKPADSSVAEEVGEDDVVRVDSNLVIIPASVVDSRGLAVTDLQLADFELKVDGEVKPISDLSRAETPVNIMMLFDNSQSLSAARAFEKQAAVRFFQSIVRPIDRAAIYSITTVPVLAQPLTNDVRRLVGSIERFGEPEGATALYDAVAQAADYMLPVPGRKVLVLVSDGKDTFSDIDFDEALNRALRADCQIYVVQTGQLEEPTLHDTFAEERLRKMTEQTGGAVFVPRTVADLDTVFAQISQDLARQYLISYYPQDERKDKYFRFISVRVKARPHLRVRARKGFYPVAARNDAPPTHGVRAPVSSASATRPEPSSAALTPASRANDLASQRRAAQGGGAVSLTNRSDTGRRSGPAGPDDEERTKAAPAANDPTPTFTLTVAANEPTPMPAPPASASRMSDAPTPTAATPTAPPAPTPTPTPTPLPTPTPTLTPTPTPEPSPTKEEARAKAPAAGGVLNAKAVNLPKPAYPTAARSAGAVGTVVVEVLIDEQGKVIEARAISGHPLLQAAAVNAARLAKFSPAVLSGAPTKVTGTIRYSFVWQ
jgi:Ca-activated chloride channel family protein